MANSPDVSNGLEGVPLVNLCDSLLAFRTAEYRVRLIEKMKGECIGVPSDLLRVSQEALEAKLQTQANFTVVELADIKSLRDAAQADASTDRRGGRREQRGGYRDRSRSNNRHGRGRYRDGDRRGDCRGRRDDGRRDDGRRGDGRRGGNEDRPKQQKPDLWGAVEQGDEDIVQLCINRGDDAEEKYLGWSPLMKASEEGHLSIMRILIEKRADLEVANKKGRTALSFAAAPSMKRETPLPALRLLLDSGADMRRRDDSGLTAKDKAEKEQRQEAVMLLEEYENMHLQRASGVRGDVGSEP